MSRSRQERTGRRISRRPPLLAREPPPRGDLHQQLVRSIATSAGLRSIRTDDPDACGWLLLWYSQSGPSTTPARHGPTRVVRCGCAGRRIWELATNLATSTIASRLGPASPRGIGRDGADGAGSNAAVRNPPSSTPPHEVCVGGCCRREEGDEYPPHPVRHDWSLRFETMPRPTRLWRRGRRNNMRSAR
jgi:hypothetical protein